MFKNAKVGDKVWEIEKGDTIIFAIRSNNEYPIETSSSTYTYEGKRYNTDKFPSLFWAKPYDKLPEQPKRKVKKLISLDAMVSDRGEILQVIMNPAIKIYNGVAQITLTGEVEIEE